MTRRTFVASVGTVIALLTVSLVVGQQSTHSAAAPPTPNGRYQLFEGPVTTIFDTQTGKIYKWFPRDEKAGKDPSIFVMDPVNGQGVEVEIKWAKKALQ
ncbi:MAG TPA: hypothetical protein VF173_37955 [Thermoanaerobaculia bacterium]|nr:hypothetical protein [Thermoanaerobaculia bacterium]